VPEQKRSTPPRYNYRLIVEERDTGWEVIFYDTEGRVQHISRSDNEIGALRSAYFMAHYYHYDRDVLIRTRHGDKMIDIENLMRNRRPQR
jgi:hypothetical protein